MIVETQSKYIKIHTNGSKIKRMNRNFVRKYKIPECDDEDDTNIRTHEEPIHIIM